MHSLAKHCKVISTASWSSFSYATSVSSLLFKVVYNIKNEGIKMEKEQSY